MSRGGTQQSLRPSGPDDVAWAVRKILRPWRKVELSEPAPTREGLEEVSRVMFMLVVRNKMFLKALEGANVDLLETSTEAINGFLSVHEMLVANLCLLRAGQVGVLEVADLVEDARQASESLTRHRATLLAELPSSARAQVMDGEWTVRVSTEEIREEMDRGSTLISSSADAVLDSDWLDGLVPEDEPPEFQAPVTPRAARGASAALRATPQ